LLALFAHLLVGGSGSLGLSNLALMVLVVGITIVLIGADLADLNVDFLKEIVFH